MNKKITIVSGIVGLCISVLILCFIIGSAENKNTNIPSKSNIKGVLQVSPKLLSNREVEKQHASSARKHVIVNQVHVMIEPEVATAETGEEMETDGPNEARAQDFRQTMNPALGRPTPENLPIIKQQIKNNASLLSSPGSTAIPWVERGPKNVGGRTRSLMIDPNDATKKSFWAAGVDGGLWKTTDITAATPNWTWVSDSFVNMAITSMAYDSTNNDTMYFGTGEVWYNEDAVRGFGVWRTVDKGAHWSQLSSTTGSSFNFINKIVVHPTNHKVYIATTDGVYMSTNAGNTFTQIGFSYKNISDIKLNQAGRLYIGIATVNSTQGFHYTDNDGSVWDPVNHNFDSVVGNADRIELAIAPSNPNIMYAVVGTLAGINGIYKSTNAGLSWLPTANATWYDQFCATGSSDFTRGASWYNLCIAVNPTDPNNVMIGGIDLLKTSNGGTSWTQITSWASACSRQYVHGDQHIIYYEPGSSDVAYFGNDGGIYRTTNASASVPTITERNTNYNVTQFYSCAASPASGSNIMLAGSQDNGTQRFSSAGINATTGVLSGDGGYCFIDQTNPSIHIGSSVYNNYYLSTNAGVNFSANLITNSITGMFINPADYDDNNHILYTCQNNYSLWRVKNINTTPSSPQTLSISGMTDYASHIRVSPYTTASSTLFVGTSVGQVLKVTGADNTPTSTDITGSAFPQYSNVSCIEVGANENELLVTFSNYGVNSLWYTSNGGTTWVSKEGDLPDMPVRWALFNPSNRKEVILATELGIWVSTNFNAAYPNWTPSNSGLAMVRVDMLQLRNSDTMIFAATHGRGLYSSKGFSAAPVPGFTASTLEPCLNQTVTFTDTSALNPTSWYWSITPSTYSFTGSTTANSKNPQVKFTVPGESYSITLNVTNSFGSNTYTKTNYIKTPIITNDTISTNQTICYGSIPNTLVGTLPSGGAGATFTGYKINEEFTGTIIPLGWSLSLNQNNLLRADTPNSYGRAGSKGRVRADNSIKSTGTMARLNTRIFAPTIQQEALRFDVAHAAYPTLTDSLIVYASNGVAFSRLAAWASAQSVDSVNGITTADPSYTTFVPSPTQWTMKTLSLPMGTVQIRFEFYSGYGNNIYIDRVQVDSFAYPIDYLWQKSTVSAGSGFIAASGTNNTKNYSSPALTQNTWFRRVITSGPCTSDTSNVVSVTINSLPTATASAASATTFCQGGSVTLNANTGTGLTYQWRNNGANISGATGSSYVASASGNYKVVVTNSNSCVDSSNTVSVTVNTLPTATATPAGSTSFCQGGNVTLNANTGTGLTYQWRVNGTNISGATNSSYVASTTGNYKVVVTNSNGCIDSSSAVAVTVFLLPTVSISPSGPTTFCSGNAVILSASASGSPTYQWRKNGANISGSTGSSYFATTSGDYKVITTSTNSCVDSSSAITVLVYATPTANFNFANACKGDVVYFTSSSFITSGIISNYTWTFGDGGTSTSINPTHTYSTAGTFNAKLIVTSNNGCLDSITKTVTIYPRAVPDFSASNVCLGTPIVFSNNSTISSGSVIYKWRFGNGDISNLTAPTYTYASAGTYNVTLIATTIFGCIDSTTKSVTIFPRATVGFNAVNVCLGYPMNFTSTSTVSSGSITYYHWDFGDGNTSLLPGTSNSYTAAGTYTVKLFVTTSNGCSDSVSKNVTVYGMQSAVATAAGPTTFCAGSNVLLKATTGTGLTYQWRKDGADITGATDTTYLANSTGSYKLVITNTNNCLDSSSAINVTVNPLPLANATANGATTFCLGGNVILKANTGAGLKYQWKKNGNDIAGATDSVFLVNASGSYKVVVTNASSCIDSSSAITITVNPLPVASASAVGATTFCSGDSVTLNANTGNGLTYQWRNNFTPIAGATDAIYIAKSSGSYKVSVKNANGCEDSSSAIVVIVNPLPSTPIITLNNFKLATVSTAAGYQWYRNDSVITGSTQNNYSVTINGSYKLKITDANGCSVFSNSININNVGLNSNNSTTHISVYPNPASSKLFIKVSGNSFENTDYFILNSIGQTIQYGILTNHETEVNISELAAGVYLVKVGNEEIKFIKK